MTRARTYPKADTTTQWWENAFTRGTFSGIEKILLHTTETTGWPGYKSGASAPTLTYHPRLRRWRQHCYLNRSARALVDPSGTLVRENRDNVIQIEIIAYSDEKLAGTVGGLPVSKLTDAQLGDIADFIAFIRREYGGPPLVAPKFLPYPQSAGDSPVRMSGPTYDAFRGILGHQHASGNGHGDPGGLNVARILQLAGGIPTPAPVSPAPEPPKGTFMSLTPDQELTVFKAAQRTMGRDPQRYMAWDATNKRWNSVDVDAPGARPAPSLDSLDGQTLREDISREAARLASQLAGVVKTLEVVGAANGLTQADLDAIRKASTDAVNEALDERISGAEVNLQVTPPTA